MTSLRPTRPGSLGKLTSFNKWSLGSDFCIFKYHRVKPKLLFHYLRVKIQRDSIVSVSKHPHWSSSNGRSVLPRWFAGLGCIWVGMVVSSFQLSSRATMQLTPLPIEQALLITVGFPWITLKALEYKDSTMFNTLQGDVVPLSRHC